MKLGKSIVEKCNPHNSYVVNDHVVIIEFSNKETLKLSKWVSQEIISKTKRHFVDVHSVNLFPMNGIRFHSRMY